MKYIVFIVSVIFFILFVLAIFRNKTQKNDMEKFSQINVEDRYTNDKCCTENEIEKCESYAKTGVCNYNKKDKSCLCQNALF